MSFPTVPLPLTEADFEPGTAELTYFTGPTIEIMGGLFHSFAFATGTDQHGDHCALDAECNEKYGSLQGFFAGEYRTITLRGKACVLVIHPFAD